MDLLNISKPIKNNYLRTSVFINIIFQPTFLALAVNIFQIVWLETDKLRLLVNLNKASIFFTISII